MKIDTSANQLQTQTVEMLGRLSGISLEMLPGMLLEEPDWRGLFCHKVRLGADGQLVQSGQSIRYSLIAWVGLFSAGGRALLDSPTWKLAESELLRRLRDHPSDFILSEIGLLLSLSTYSKALPSERLWSLLERRWPAEKKYLDSMDAGLLLAALSMAGFGTPGQEAIASELVKILLAAYRKESHLFALRRKRWLGTRDHTTILGSFASQVYPLLGLSLYLEKRSHPAALGAVRECAARVCQLQGPLGEWWWIYDPRDSTVVLDYPVYSIHQDGMGPMALLAAQRVVPGADYTNSINKSAAYTFYEHPQAGGSLADHQRGIIWRAIIKDFPGDPADRSFGLSEEELAYMLAVARGKPANSPNSSGFRLLKEARPYCPGWILFAYSQACFTYGLPGQLRVAI